MLRRIALVLCLFVLFAGSGCRKKSSHAFYDAQGRYSVVTAKFGEDAYDDPEMAAIEGLLRGVTARHKEYPQAQTLLATIGSEKARIANVKAELAKPVNAPTNTYVPPPASIQMPTVTSVAVTTVDAGFSPKMGMTIEAFLAAYSACMDQGDDIMMPGSKAPAQAYAVRKTARCLEQFGGSEKVTKLYVFSEKKLVGEATRTEPDSDKPFAGMTADTFMKNFGNCMVAGADIKMPGASVPSQAFNVKKDKACTDKFGGAGDTVKSFVFNQGKLVGETTQQLNPPPPPLPNFIPGSAIPSGVNSALPPPDPSTAVTPDSNQQQR